MLYLAENLKSHRNRLKLTQEEVAESLSVSPQSVSKWERGDTYPDITLLPALANLFKTSIDALVGMDKINNSQARARLFTTEHDYLKSGDYHRAASVLEEALKTFPNDEGIVSEFALALSFDKSTDSLQRSARLCERVLSQALSEKIRHTTRAALCFIYLKLGDKEKAVAMARNLPHVRESRETILSQLDKETSAEEIDTNLRFIALGEEAEQDIVCIDFGVDMIPIAEDLWASIHTLRNRLGQQAIPMVRVKDNGSLLPNQVRLRYYADFLLDEEFPDGKKAVDKLLTVLSELSRK
jgi:transcriptional regulator with XRE-family HTH domain